MRYLYGTATHGIYYGPNTNGDTQVAGYCDPDWGSVVDVYKSTTGYYFLLVKGH